MIPNKKHYDYTQKIHPDPYVLETRIEGLRRDVSRLYKWIVALAGSNVSLVVTIILKTWLSV